jgi:hypothetical protein
MFAQVRGPLSGPGSRCNKLGRYDDYPVYSFTSLLADLATICANHIEPADDLPAFTMITAPPTRLQRRAFELLAADHPDTHGLYLLRPRLQRQNPAGFGDPRAARLLQPLSPSARAAAKRRSERDHHRPQRTHRGQLRRRLPSAGRPVRAAVVTAELPDPNQRAHWQTRRAHESSSKVLRRPFPAEARWCIDAFFTIYWAAIGRPEQSRASSRHLAPDPLAALAGAPPRRKWLQRPGSAARTVPP